MVVQNELDILKPAFSKIELSNEICSKLIVYDVKGIADKRKENFVLIDKMIKNIAGLRVFKELNNGDIPHNYPIIVENGLREKLYFWLLERNLPLIALYYRLIKPLQNEKFASMQEISNNIINLPVHQDIEKEDIIKLMNEISLFYE